jgi:hypothetical protein
MARGQAAHRLYTRRIQTPRPPRRDRTTVHTQHETPSHPKCIRSTPHSHTRFTTPHTKITINRGHRTARGQAAHSSMVSWAAAGPCSSTHCSRLYRRNQSLHSAKCDAHSQPRDVKYIHLRSDTAPTSMGPVQSNSDSRSNPSPQRRNSARRTPRHSRSCTSRPATLPPCSCCLVAAVRPRRAKLRLVALAIVRVLARVIWRPCHLLSEGERHNRCDHGKPKKQRHLDLHRSLPVDLRIMT